MLNNDLEERLLDFAARVGRVVDALPESRMGRHVADQLIRSGTSPAPNYAEAQAGESRRDFTHKLNIVLKEMHESRVWLRLIVKSDLLPQGLVTNLLDECEQLCRILGKSIVSAKKNRSQVKSPIEERSPKPEPRPD